VITCSYRTSSNRNGIVDRSFFKKKKKIIPAFVNSYLRRDPFQNPNKDNLIPFWNAMRDCFRFWKLPIWYRCPCGRIFWQWPDPYISEKSKMVWDGFRPIGRFLATTPITNLFVIIISQTRSPPQGFRIPIVVAHAIQTSSTHSSRKVITIL
jgi:hypothetical protein